MDSVQLLFAKYDFSAAVRDAASAIQTAVDKLPDSALFDADADATVASLVQQHTINVPRLDLDSINPPEHDVDLEVSQALFGICRIYCDSSYRSHQMADTLNAG